MSVVVELIERGMNIDTKANLASGTTKIITYFNINLSIYFKYGKLFIAQIWMFSNYL